MGSNQLSNLEKLINSVPEGELHSVIEELNEGSASKNYIQIINSIYQKQESENIKVRPANLSRIKNYAFNALLKKYALVRAGIENRNLALVEAIILKNAKLYGLAIKKVFLGIEEAKSRNELFLRGQFLEIGIFCIGKCPESISDEKKLQKLILEQRSYQQELKELLSHQNLWVNVYLPIFRNKIVSGEIDKSYSELLQDELKQVPKPEFSQKALLIRMRLEAYLYKLNQDYKGVISVSENIIRLLESNKFLPQNGVYNQAVFALVISNSELGNHKKAENYLNVLNDIYLKEPTTGNLRNLLIGNIVVAESFKSEKAFHQVNSIIRDNAGFLKTLNDANTYFSLLRLNFVNRRYNESKKYFEAIYSLGKDYPQIGVQVYTRVYHCLYNLLKGDWEETQRLSKNTLSYIQRNSDSESFSMACFLLKEFRKIARKVNIKSIEEETQSIRKNAPNHANPSYLEMIYFPVNDVFPE